MFEKATTPEERAQRHAMQQRARKTRGKNKVIRLKKLIATANSEHRLSIKRQVDSLVHAKQAGDALNKLFKHVGRKDWKSWLKDNFKGSYETATAYRRVSKKWEDPVVQEARHEGTLTSIKKLLDVVAKKRSWEGEPLDQAEIDKLRQPTKKEILQQSILLQIKGRIKRLKLPLLKAIEDHAQEIWQAAIAEAKHHAAKRLRQKLQYVEPEEDDENDQDPDEIHEREMRVFAKLRQCLNEEDAA